MDDVFEKRKRNVSKFDPRGPRHCVRAERVNSLNKDYHSSRQSRLIVHFFQHTGRSSGFVEMVCLNAEFARFALEVES